MAGYKIDTTGGGTGVFTIATPNSNTDRTLTLPDEAGTVLTSSTAASSIPGHGNQITEIDTWQVTSNFTITSSFSYITANWARATNDGTGNKGTGMSQSSGVFTFPSTGIWLVSFKLDIFYDSGAFAYANINSTTDGSTYDATVQGAHSGSSGQVVCGGCMFLFNVADTSTHKIKVATQSSGGNITGLAGSDATKTSVFFIKLGDS